MNILLVQLLSLGDCLLATPVARQIKEIDFPGCRLSWLVAESCAQVVRNNPYVDEILTADTRSRNDLPLLLAACRAQAFDRVIITDCCADNEPLYWGNTRNAILRTYGKPLDVPLEPVLALTSAERARVARFAQTNGLDREGVYPILFECAPQSNQSSMNTGAALHIARLLTARHPEVRVILSSRNRLELSSPCILDGSALSWRENAELTRYCKLLIGCSSGISWLNTSTAAAKIPMLQLLGAREDYAESVLSASMAEDFALNDLPADDLIELNSWDNDTVVTLTETIIRSGIREAKRQTPGVCFRTPEDVLRLQAGQIARAYHQRRAATSRLYVIRRFGLRPWCRDLLLCRLRKLGDLLGWRQQVHIRAIPCNECSEETASATNAGTAGHGGQNT